MRDHYPETIVPESRPGDPNTAVREISTEQAAREEALVRGGGGVVRRHAVAPVEAADTGPDPAPARVRPRGPADRAGMGRRDRVPHPMPGTSPTTGGRSSSCCPTCSGVSMQTIDDQQRGPRRRDRGDRVRAVLRRGLARDPDRRRHRRRRRRGAVLGRGHGHRHRRQAGRRAPGSRSGRPTRTASTTCSTPTTAPRPAATCSADDEGRYAFWGVTPTPYPIPHDGPVGDLLAATGRSPMRASHLHFMVSPPRACARW